MTHPDWTDHRVEQTVGNLLRIGVLVSTAIVLTGGAIYLLRHSGERADHFTFHGEPIELCHPVGIVREAWSLTGRGVIQLGLLVLIATPVFRVVFSAYAFWRQRDRAYIAITLIVLAVLAFGLLSGRGG
jgi:uncharacterized membrane protein